MTTAHSRADALMIPRDLLNDLIDDVQSFADQVPCREREKAFRADLLARARAFAGSPSLQPAAAPIEYRYEGGTHWCDLGPAERMRPDFKGVYRLKAGTFPVWAGEPAPSPADERAALSDQDIYDKFSFLEGLVNESTYMQIADTAIEIARAGYKS